MTEIRRDPLQRWRILVAEHRAGRPNEYRTRGELGEAPASCPFCPGNEKETPPEIAADRPPGSAPNDPEWTLRVVPNRYPAIREGVAPDFVERSGFASIPALGSHEVIIETREHAARLETMQSHQVVRFLHHVRERTRMFAASGVVEQVLMFRNCGAASGASLSHPHTQIVAAAEKSTDSKIQSKALQAHRDAVGRCLICDLVGAELEARDRVIARRGDLVAFVPYAARYGAEIWIGPARHAGHFVDIDDATLPSLAELLQLVLSRALRRLDDPSYNLMLTAWEAPSRAGGDHWRFEFVPRLANVGGFELATGDFIVSRSPERIASLLRQE